MMAHFFDYTFMRQGVLAAVLVGTACGLIGPYVVLRRISFIGHALTHSALPGLVAAHVYGFPLFQGAFVANVFTAVGISQMTLRDRCREDAVVALLSNGMFAFGLVWMARLRSFRDLSHMLFGNILGISTLDLWLMGGVVAILAASLLLFHKEWELVSFDPVQAKMVGLPVEKMRALLLLLLVLVVVSGIQAVGTVLTGALLVAPASASLLVSRRLPWVMVISCGIGALSGIMGLVLSYVWALPSGATIVLCGTGFYGLAWVVHIGWKGKNRS